MTMKTILVSGNFNVLHLGHQRLLRFAKDLGGRLIVAIESDRLAGNRAFVNEKMRLEGLKFNTWVDDVFVFDEPISELIARIRPDFVVKGKEHESQFNPELNELSKYGGKLLFSSGENTFCSLDLIRKEFSYFDHLAIQLPLAFMERHQVTTGQLRKIVDSFSSLRVCVIGDIIIDEYITCQPLGMSQEDPTIVVTPLDSVRFVGGAGIVAAHAAGLGATVSFHSVTGEDASRDFALDKLKEFGVNVHLLIDKERPTTLKQRYRCNGKSLLRVSHLHQSSISKDLQDVFLAQMKLELEKTNLLVFSDFNYGCLPQFLVEQIIDIARCHQVMIVADSQSSSQVGHIGRFKNMDMITPTEREARISTRNTEDGLIILAEQLINQTNAKHVLLKLGEEGLLIHNSINPQQNMWITDRIEALNANPKDVAGAGDSLLIAGAMSLASGSNIWEAACLGSIAAAIQVGRVGNTPIQTEELLMELK
jgi:rfaE bifunctional protein kinase chain/domain